MGHHQQKFLSEEAKHLLRISFSQKERHIAWVLLSSKGNLQDSFPLTKFSIPLTLFS